MKIEVFDFHQITPFAEYGFTHPFWGVHIDTLIYSWIAVGLLAVFALVFRYYFLNRKSYVYAAVEYMVSALLSFSVESVGYFRYDYFIYVVSLFVFTLILCLVGLLPYVEEATKDPNTTFAISLSSFFFVVYKKIFADGITGFIAQFFHTFPTDSESLSARIPAYIGNILMSPLEIMSQFSRIISISFRLFGNILGGSIVFFLLVELFRSVQQSFLLYVVVVGGASFIYFKLFRRDGSSRFGQILNLLLIFVFLLSYFQAFFGIFESLVQAFVIAMLTTTYVSNAISHDIKNDPKGIAW